MFVKKEVSSFRVRNGGRGASDHLDKEQISREAELPAVDASEKEKS